MLQNTDQSPQPPPLTSDGASLKVLLVVILLAGVIGALLIQVHRHQSSIPLRVLIATSPTPAGEILYRELAGISTGLTESRGIALDPAGNLYVVGDQALERIDIMHGGPELVARFAAKPTCVTSASAGGIAVGFADHIELLTRKGVSTSSWSSLGPRAMLTAVAAGKDGMLWAADAGNREIVGFDGSGSVIRRIGHRDDARHIPGLVVPSPYMDVVVASDGTLVVTNPGLRQVEYYRPTGDLLRSWGHSANDAEGFAGCCNPTNIALLPDGRVITGEKGIPRVKLYTADGSYLGMVAPPETIHPSAAGLALAVASDGRVFTLDPTTNMVRIFVPK